MENIEQNQLSQQLNKKNEYELKRQEKLDEQERVQKKREFKRWSKIALIIIVVGGGIGALVWYIASQPKTPPSELISKNGIHWHPELSIYVKGEKQEINANLGMGAGMMAAVHTHDTTGVLHLEPRGRVTKNDTKIGVFFKIWRKQFSSNCIFDSCNGPEGTVKMLVNGAENNEFENYQMNDKDKIEIRFE